jgi:hypothetical protein
LSRVTTNVGVPANSAANKKRTQTRDTWRIGRRPILRD